MKIRKKWLVPPIIELLASLTFILLGMLGVLEWLLSSPPTPLLPRF